MQLGYGEKKIIFIGAASIAPLFAFMIATLIGFPIIGALAIGAIVWILSVLGGHLATSQNAWIKAVQNEEPLVLDLNSTGVGRSWNVKVNDNPLNGKDIVLPDGTTMTYDRMITHLVGEPKNGYLYKEELTGKDGKPKTYLMAILPFEEYNQSIWGMDNKTMLIFDSVAGVYLTKPYLGATEKELMSEYITLNELRELRELSKVLRELTRHTFDLIASRFGALLSNPIVMFVIAAIILAGVGFVILQVMPGLAPTASQVAQPIAQALPTGGA